MLADVGGFYDAIYIPLSVLIGFLYTPALYSRAKLEGTVYDPRRRFKSKAIPKSIIGHTFLEEDVQQICERIFNYNKLKISICAALFRKPLLCGKGCADRSSRVKFKV